MIDWIATHRFANCWIAPGQPLCRFAEVAPTPPLHSRQSAPRHRRLDSHAAGCLLPSASRCARAAASGTPPTLLPLSHPQPAAMAADSCDWSATRARPLHGRWWRRRGARGAGDRSGCAAVVQRGSQRRAALRRRSRCGLRVSRLSLSRINAFKAHLAHSLPYLGLLLTPDALPTPTSTGPCW
jgi:hypothetical protein